MQLSRSPVVAITLILISTSWLNGQVSDRRASISKRVFCSCGCREVLNECSHKQCERKPAMMQEISTAIGEGKNDQQILDQMSARFGADILLVPGFRGFNAMLWIVPIAIGVVAMGGTVIAQRRRISRAKRNS